MTNDSFFPGLAAAARNVVCWCSFFWLFSMIEDNEVHGLRLLPFLAAGVACYLLCRAFLRVPRSIPALVGLAAGLTAAVSILLLWKCSDLSGFWWSVFSVTAVASVVVCNIMNCTEPPAAAKSISAMELTTSFFVVFLWVQTVSGMDAMYSVPLLGASLLSLVVVLYQRISSVGGGAGHSRMRGLAIVAAALAGIVAVLALFVAFGAAPLGDGVVLMVRCVIYCLKMLLLLITAFFNWLARLLPPPEVGGALEPMTGFQIPEGMEEVEEVNPMVAIVMGAIGICLLLGCLVYLVYRLRKVRVGGGGAVRAAGQVQRRRISLLGWLRQLWAAVSRRVGLIAAILSMRGSPQELYLFLTRAGRRLDLRKQPGETPCAFVRRAARMTAGGGEDPELTAALEALAAALETCLYARRAEVSFPRDRGRRIRRGFRRALRRARRERLKTWLRTRQKRGAQAA